MNTNGSRQQIINELEKLRRELEEETEARSLFINALAHELKTPLTIILASAGVLHESLASQPESFKSVLASNTVNAAQTLAARLDELLDLARVCSGTFGVELQSLDARNFLERLVLCLRPICEQRAQRLTLDLPEGLPMIEADPSRLEQVLTNLVSNASKFSHEGGNITLRVRTADSELIIEVEDQGIGIRAEEQERLFKPYHRVEQDSQRFAGLGLGLAVSRQIVEAHRGNMWLQSELGRGSIFGFSLPVRSDCTCETGDVRRKITGNSHLRGETSRAGSNELGKRITGGKLETLVNEDDSAPVEAAKLCGKTSPT